ncbi:adhesin SprC [Flavobacterium palustre]|uniref:Adhesin SprC n=1 Tax=Flavobacterium palustre TaxID=1476463 RepID=A0ABQ1HBB2_9FLAO|nr:adhesin SprC [Flavobacterium palustre]
MQFSQICANASFNNFSVSFTFSSPASLSPTNQFIVELSDATGFFSNPTVLATTNPGAVTTSPATISFSVPTNTAGEQYKIRIKSTGPVASSSNSLAFSAYYKIQDSQFTINNFKSIATYCAGGSYLLTIDNPGTGTNDSPLKYPSLTYNWYKEPSLTPIATGQTLTVNQPGTYYVKTNYGSCTSDSYSNKVTVNEATSGTSTTITSSLGNPFCSNQGSTTLTTVIGNSYQWYKDNKIISGATNQSYITNQSGLYSVTVNYGGCVANASIDLKTNSFSSSINIPATNYIDTESGETLSVSVTSSASNPEYKWYLNNTIIPNANGSNYDVNTIGNYKVVVSQTSGCVSSEELTFTVQALMNSNATEIPNLISPNNDGVNDTWIIPQEYTSGTETEVLIISAIGEIVLRTNNYQNNWPENATNFKNVNPVYYYIITTKDGQTRKGSVTIIK